MDGINLADMKTVLNGENGGTNFIEWLVLIFLFAGRGFGFGGTTEGTAALNTDFAILERKLDGISNGICSSQYEASRLNADTNMAIAQGNSALQMALAQGFASQAQCCCETNRNIDAVRYEAANNTAAINANVTSQVQRVLDKMSADREADLQARINQLEMRASTCDIPRINPFAWGVYSMPTCGCGCGFTQASM